MSSLSERYKEAGVDIDAGDDFVKRIRSAVEATHGPGVQGPFGHYGALFSLAHLNPHNGLLVSSTDGVGTKLELVRKLDDWMGIGQDLVAMCANDILCLGARPLFFLDYLATGKLDVEVAVRLVEGIAGACKQIGCAVTGGETAEMPGLYQEGKLDLAGFIVGWVQEDQLVNGKEIQEGDCVVGIASDGFHSNGFSLVRMIIENAHLDLDLPLIEGNPPLGKQLLTPTRLYGPVMEKIADIPGIHGIAHITGGGLVGNLPRILPDQYRITLDHSLWSRPALMQRFQELGHISEDEMLRVFNDGIGLSLVVAESAADTILKELERSGEKAWVIGRVEARGPESPPVIVQ
jgi:phosphoribosylformylglycinamidine cyclo-ligase